MSLARALLAALLAAFVAGCNGTPESPAQSAPTDAAACLPGDGGFLRARLRGALEEDIDWQREQLSCEGNPRPDDGGIRISIRGRIENGAKSVRFVFGMRAQPGEPEARAVPTNLTVILEGEQRIFATQGDSRCTVDELRQSPLEGSAAQFRVEARGFCTEPAAAVGSEERLLLVRFDFAARLALEDPAAPALQAAAR